MSLIIPEFDIEAAIGHGAMATVYLATQCSLERKVALKVMAATLAADPAFCERFLREGKMLARLSHPHIVTIHDIGHADELYYMAMEYLPHGTLKERIDAGISIDTGLAYIRQIASALGYAHSQGLVHRDVKPANILFRANGTAVLSDFGIAKSLDERTQFTQAGFAVGTPSYMSPEQARGHAIDGRADLYALGVILYQMLVGKLPYSGTDALSTALAHLTEPMPALPLHQGCYQYVLGKLLAKDPADRFADAQALLAALDDLQDDDRDLTLLAPRSSASAGRTSEVVSLLMATQAGALESDVQSTAQPPSASAVTQRSSHLRLTLLAVAITTALGLAVAGYGGWRGSRTSPSSTPASVPIKPTQGNRPPALTVPVVQPTQALPESTSNSESSRRPLLMPGKQTLYQRVLSKPGALYSSAGAAAERKALPAFSVLYVYERKDVYGSEWLRVGPASDGRSEGWLPASEVSEWKQSLVLKLTERSGRAPVMFMRHSSDLEKLLNDPSAAKTLLHEAQQSRSGHPQVLALEPENAAIPQAQFHLLPILDSKESFDDSGQPVQLLNVASIDPGHPTPDAGATQPAAVGDDAFRTAVVLVVDTSKSMQPYIDQVRNVVRELQDQIGRRGELNSVSFGLVGFRSSVAKTPGLEYVAKTLVTLDQGRDPQQFLTLAEQIKATSVSSHAFSEDAFAGVMQAVNGMDWSGYGGRLILLVSDAGSLRKSDPYSSTQMNEAEIRQAALSKDIKVYALHLRTHAGKQNHVFAEQQYRTLTADANPQIGDLYVPIPDGDVHTFAKRLAEVGSVFADLVHQVRTKPTQPVPLLAPGATLAARSAAVGYAMHMDFLGRRARSDTPSLVSAWAADRDLTNPALPAFQVCVMLTKLQLNDLQQSLKLIVQAARKTQTSPKDFFQEIASASAFMSRDPAALRKGGNLADGGLLGEYLEGLPYRSKSLSMSQDLWLSLSVAEQEDFIDELESKIQLYETFHNDLSNWVRFGDAEPGDALYRVPLSTLP
jgi:serine/threonine-protein kinase PpkA